MAEYPAMGGVTEEREERDEDLEREGEERKGAVDAIGEKGGAKRRQGRRERW